MDHLLSREKLVAIFGTDLVWSRGKITKLTPDEIALQFFRVKDSITYQAVKLTGGLGTKRFLLPNVTVTGSYSPHLLARCFAPLKCRNQPTINSPLAKPDVEFTPAH